ncbi:hypothetical protein N7532_001083 [Penicillium argentinense]|uniref:Uncharacterized protein n=1 Tax=Penicillium argentinense TaxID=1131581 RepID=A0A9W9KM39_9EURO|nr:uncharacterized protein N7532_001083 [Penicillium argentinense]KAJ5110548.1 hypothetical protein N7532_001083 [Penicillium argentinense]
MTEHPRIDIVLFTGVIYTVEKDQAICEKAALSNTTTRVSPANPCKPRRSLPPATNGIHHSTSQPANLLRAEATSTDHATDDVPNKRHTPFYK